MKSKQYTVGKYLWRRLEQLGLGHIFGVPGDFIFDLLHLLNETEIQYVGTCNELNAGYAADGYARIKGIGGVLVTYAVGGLSAVNAIAGAYAEKVPLVVISGGPQLNAYEKQLQMHHTIGDYTIPLEIFKKITVAAACILDPETATRTIDNLLQNCVQYKRPVYLEIPCDLAQYPCEYPSNKFFVDYAISLENNLRAILNLTLELLLKAKNPVFIIGIEIQRYNIQDLMLELINNTECAFSTFVTDKTALTEDHRQFIGCCGPGIKMTEETRQYIEQSDCIICLGSLIANHHLKNFLVSLNLDNMISAFDNQISFRGAIYQVSIYEFIKSLNEYFKETKKNLAINSDEYISKNKTVVPMNFTTDKTGKITHDRVFEFIGFSLQENDVLLVDTGSSLLKARKILMPHKTLFLSQSYYASIGYSLAATLGVALAHPLARVITIVGDGAFQFTCQELSTLIRLNLKCTIVLINNKGYSIERALHKDSSYNDIQPWKYYKLPSVFDGYDGREVYTERDLEEALDWAKGNSGISLIEVHLEKYDFCSDLGEIIEP